MHVLRWQNVSVLTRELFLCLCPTLWSNEGIKHNNNPQVSTETVCYESTYIIVFLTWHNKSINDDKNYDFYTLWLFIYPYASRSPTEIQTIILRIYEKWLDRVNISGDELYGETVMFHPGILPHFPCHVESLYWFSTYQQSVTPTFKLYAHKVLCDIEPWLIGL